MNHTGAGQIIQTVKHLLCKKEELTVIFKAHIKNPDVMTCDCNFSVGETEKGGWLRLAGKPAKLNWQAPVPGGDLFSENQVTEPEEGERRLISGSHMHNNTCVDT